VEVDGRIVRGCLSLAVQADGCSVRTIEGLSRDGDVRDLQEAFVRHNALQCGFCTPGMVMAAKELLEQKPDATRTEVREWMSGNYCRCTGYHAIVDAICETLGARGGAAPGARMNATALRRRRRAKSSNGRSPEAPLPPSPKTRATSAPAASGRARAGWCRAGRLRRRHRAAAHGARRVLAQPGGALPHPEASTPRRRAACPAW
jgi:hypothetical protein